MVVQVLVLVASVLTLHVSRADEGGAPAPKTGKTGKTVVVVLADDVDDTLLPLDSVDVMPNLHAFRRLPGSVSFTQSFVTIPVCCVSDHEVMT